MKEAWLLRDSIKVKVDGGNNQSGSQRRRAEALRNEASVALRGVAMIPIMAGKERGKHPTLRLFLLHLGGSIYITILILTQAIHGGWLQPVTKKACVL